MTWTDDYEPGQPVQVRYQGSWRKAQVASTRKNSLMAVLMRGAGQQTTNIHDPRNIKPCPPVPKPSTLNDQQSFA